MAAFLANLGPRARKVLRYLGFVALALFTFVLAFQLTFPFDRVKDKVIEALSDKYDVTIGDVERGLMPGRLYFKAFSLRTRPAKSTDIATTFYMDQLEVDLGLLALMHGAVSVKLDAKIGQGHIKGKVGQSKDGVSVHVTGDDLPSASLPVREALGLPMSGKVRFKVDLELPYDRSKTGKGPPALNLQKADGDIEFACPSGCSVGDGKSKLKLTTNNARQQAFLDEGGGGIDFGKVNIDSLLADVELKNGKLDITKFDTRSGDGELHIVFGMTLNADLQSSQVAGCLRFRGSDALLKREPKTHAAISTTGAPLGPDNLFHIKLEGPLRQVRRIGVLCGPSASGSGSGINMDNPGGAPPRPNLTVTPEPPKPPGLGSVSVPPPAIQPPPPPVQQATIPTAAPAAPPAAGSAPHPGNIGEAPAPTVFPSPGAGNDMPQPAQGSGFAPLPVPQQPPPPAGAPQ